MTKNLLVGKKVILSMFTCFVFVCLVGLSLPEVAGAAEPMSEKWLSNQVSTIPIEKDVKYAVYIKNLKLDDKAVVLNSHKMASASLIKIPIMIEAFNQKKQGKLNFNEQIVIKHAQAVEGGSVYNLPDGTVLTVGQILDLMIVQSDNTAANILIDKLKMENVNTMIQKLGCKDTILQRKMMDFEAVKQGRQNYTSVTDMANILGKLYTSKCLDPASDKAMLAIMLRQEDNTVIPAQIPHDLKIAHKTGELDGMYYDCGIIYGHSTDYILCIMAENVKDEPHVLYDMSSLSLAIYDKIGR